MNGIKRIYNRIVKPIHKVKVIPRTTDEVVTVIGIGDFNVRRLLDANVNIMSIDINVHYGQIVVTFQIGSSVHRVDLSIEQAEKIGFINTDTLASIFLKHFKTKPNE